MLVFFVGLKYLDNMTVAGTDQDEFVFYYNSSNLKLPTLCASLNLELDKTVLMGSSEYATNLIEGTTNYKVVKKA